MIALSQATYGHGTVVAANDQHTVIEFDEHGSRTFSTRLVRLERSTVAAPQKPVKTRLARAGAREAGGRQGRELTPTSAREPRRGRLVCQQDRRHPPAH